VATGEYEQYFLRIEHELQTLYNVARQARMKGLDPALEPEPHIAKSLAESVEGLVGPPGIAPRIEELTGKISREEIAFKVSEEIIYAEGRTDDRRAAEQAIRTALALLTGGITAAPLQGISRVEIKTNSDRTKYLSIYFAGPIRSAGGTEQALTLVIGDIVRRMLGLDRYKATDDEVRRFIEETRIYEREVSRFQYHVSDEMLEYALRNLPVEVTGTETNPVEVASFRNLPRVETNRVRGGALRVVNDGIVGRSQKIWKIVEEFGLPGWDWLKRVSTPGEESAEEPAGPMFLEDVVAGRPIFSFPSKSGGFRLRYGRSRNTGLAAVGVHPATMAVLHNFLATGTQIRVELPGKACIVMPVDTIEPPIVKLDDGSLVRVTSFKDAEELKDRVEEICFLGDLLVSFGEFLENNKPTVNSGYTEEWWVQELRNSVLTMFGGSTAKLADAVKAPEERIHELVEVPLRVKPTAEEAIVLSRTLNVPLHPKYTYFWKEIEAEELSELRRSLVRSEMVKNDGFVGEIQLSLDRKTKSTLEKLRVPHRVVDGKIVITEDAPTLAISLGLDIQDVRIRSQRGSLETINDLAGVKILDKGGTYVGARMGRPEKARMRLMKPPIHVLFPVGLAGGSHRNIVEASKRELVEVEVARRVCPKCGAPSFKVKCQRCDVETTPERTCPKCHRTLGKENICPVCKLSGMPFERKSVNVKELLDEACTLVGAACPELVKGVIGLVSETKTPEHIVKGVLRERHGLYVFKDGTIRFDATNAPLTHFKPSEIGTPVEKLRELSYLYDQDGKPLHDPNQICELKVQDIIVPKECVRYLTRVANFIDELLEKVYGLPPYYRIKSEVDLLGHLITGLAPHTSAGVIGRVVGSTSAHVCYAHPFWQAAKRRDCDGDEDAVMLVLDVLLNFSKSYLPAQIGGMMDAPLLITSIVDPFEVDEQVHNMDVAGFYPVEFYERASKFTDPRIVSNLVDVITHRLGTPAQFQGYAYTHVTEDINDGNHESSYKKLGAMANKVQAQLLLAKKIRAVDSKEVAKRVLTTHFIRDIAGNLKAFTSQKFRCKKCNLKYRRIPLSGSCPRCNGEIVLTVYRGGIEKYLRIATDLAQKYDLKDFYQQRLELAEEEIESLFRGVRAKQVKLGEFM